ncbi:hypothetical protein LINGRAHAP2_LOCUS10859 [Linum grandiflorum]
MAEKRSITTKSSDDINLFISNHNQMKFKSSQDRL